MSGFQIRAAIAVATLLTLVLGVPRRAMADVSLVTSVSLNGAITRTNLAGEVGFKFTTGATPIQVTRLCRYYVYDDPGTQTVADLSVNMHTLTLYSASGVSVASVTLNNGGNFVDAHGFKCAFLAVPAPLAANTSYYLLSSEAASGARDRWYDYSITETPAFGTIVSAATRVAGVITSTGSTNNSFGPVNFYFTKSVIATATLGTTALATT
jgi:hypothetical protein